MPIHSRHLNTSSTLLIAYIFYALCASSLLAITPAEEPVVKAVQQALPTVVNIYTEGYEERRVVDPADAFFQRFFGGDFSRPNRIIRVPTRSLGSGLLVSPDGYIVTNHHVVARAGEKTAIKAVLDDHTEFEAHLVRDDEDQDLALIKIESKKPLPHLSLKKLSPNLRGQTVIAIGNPVGNESSISTGILSAKDRSLNIGEITYDGMLQTDAAINPGNSGGPLIDINSNLVGINSAKMGIAENNIAIENIGFAIPADRVKNFVEDSIAIAQGKKPEPPKASLSDVFKAKFGIEFQEMDADLAGRFGFAPYEGLLITNVLPGSQAERAGFENGMIIIRINNLSTRQLDGIPRRLYKIQTGQTLRFTVKFNVVYGRLFTQRIASVTLEAK